MIRRVLFERPEASGIYMLYRNPWFTVAAFLMYRNGMQTLHIPYLELVK